MKKYSVLLFFVVIFVCVSCSSDSEVNGPKGSVYFPVKKHNYWTYKIFTDNVLTGTDSLSVINNHSESGAIYTTLTSQQKGFFTNMMYYASLRRYSDNYLLMGGSFQFKILNSFQPFIPMNNFRLIDETAADGASLGSAQGTRMFFLNPAINNVSEDYLVTTTNEHHYDTYTTPDGITYTDVREIKFVLNIRLYEDYTINGVPQTDIYMDAHDVIVSHLYFANGIGMVYSNTVKDYYFVMPEYAGLDYPQGYHAVEEEFLQHHRANP